MRCWLKSELRAIESGNRTQLNQINGMLKSELRAIERQQHDFCSKRSSLLKSELRAIERDFMKCAIRRVIKVKIRA